MFPGKVLMSTNASTSGRDSVAVISQLAPVSREYLDPHPAGHLPGYLLSKIAA